MALTREAGAAVTVWETTATLRLLGGARGAVAPTGEERGGAYRVATRTACCISKCSYIRRVKLIQLPSVAA